MFASLPLVFLPRVPSETRTRLPRRRPSVGVSHLDSNRNRRTGLASCAADASAAADDALCGRLLRLCARTPGWDAGRCS